MTILSMPQLIKKIKDLPEAVIDRGLPDAAKAVDATLRETMSAQQTPFGDPWPPRKRGTRPVLVNAVSALSVTVLQRTIYMVVRGIEVRHHKGSVKGSVQRQMIPYVRDTPGAKRRKGKPQRGIPPRILEAVRVVFEQHFERWKREVPT